MTLIPLIQVVTNNKPNNGFPMTSLFNNQTNEKEDEALEDEISSVEVGRTLNTVECWKLPVFYLFLDDLKILVDYFVHLHLRFDMLFLLK